MAAEEKAGEEYSSYSAMEEEDDAFVCSTASLELPMIDDWHVHLRQGLMSEVVVPLLRKRSGIRRCIVMPNTLPPVVSTQMAAEYREALKKIEPNVDYKMLLYLGPEITVEDLERGKKTGFVTGVKSYPRGVTTNSEAGVESYESYYGLFSAMERLGLTLHIHGEVPGACVMEAEADFLPELDALVDSFPQLKIVLEHVSTKSAVDKILQFQRAGKKNVAASVTAHHLDITIDAVVGCCHYFCKPVPKLPADRDAIREVVFAGNPAFFFGSDSAPHPRSKKEGGKAAAGVFTGGCVVQYLADIFGQVNQLDKLENFCCVFGASFLGFEGEPPGGSSTGVSTGASVEEEARGRVGALRMLRKGSGGPRIRLTRASDQSAAVVPETFGEEILGKENAVVPFRAGEKLGYEIEILDF